MEKGYRRFFHKRYLHMHIKVKIGERRMGKGRLTPVSHVVCDYAKQRLYTQRHFDMLNGFELVITRCCNCHKTVALEVKRLV